MWLKIPLFLDTFQLLRQTFSFFCFVFLSDNLSKYFAWLKKQSLHNISALDKSNWFSSPLIDWSWEESLTSCLDEFDQFRAT